MSGKDSKTVSHRERRLKKYEAIGWLVAPRQPTGGLLGHVHGQDALGQTRTKKPTPQLPVYIGRKTKRNVPRKCLHCESPFKAETKYYRLCRRCRNRSGLFEYNH